MVWVEPFGQRNIKVAATNLSKKSIELFPVPLSLSSVQQLVTAFQQITSLEAEDVENERNRNMSDARNIHQTGKSKSVEQHSPRTDLEST